MSVCRGWLPWVSWQVGTHLGLVPFLFVAGGRRWLLQPLLRGGRRTSRGQVGEETWWEVEC